MSDGDRADHMEEAVGEYLTKEVITNQEQLPLRPETPLIASGVLDSLSLLKLVLFLEEKFGISVGMEEVVPQNFESIETICSFVRSKTGK